MARTKRRGTKKSRKRTAAPRGARIPPPAWADNPPAGATRQAFDRPLERKGGAPGSGAGPRHAAGDPGDDNESTGRVDDLHHLAEPPPVEEDALEQGPPYAGPSGGAVGGTPAEKRSKGGHMRRGRAG